MTDDSSNHNPSTDEEDGADYKDMSLLDYFALWDKDGDQGWNFDGTFCDELVNLL